MIESDADEFQRVIAAVDTPEPGADEAPISVCKALALANRKLEKSRKQITMLRDALAKAGGELYALVVERDELHKKLVYSQREAERYREQLEVQRMQGGGPR